MSRVVPALALVLLLTVAAGALTATAREPAALERVTLQLDQKAGAFRFMIDGRQVARLDAAGFTVEGDVTYTGFITDTGAQPEGASP